MAENNEVNVARKKCRTCSFEADTYQNRNEHEASTHFDNNVSDHVECMLQLLLYIIHICMYVILMLI